MSENPEQAVLHELGPDGAPKNSWNLTGKNTFKIGRGPTNDIVLPYSWISRKHTMVQRENDGIFHIMDLGSSNGTYLNSKRIHSPAILNNGDLVTLGKTTIRFHQFIENTDQKFDRSELTLDMTVAYIQKEIVTILVCDIHEFTRLSEKLGNNHISKLLQFWTKKVGAIINEHDGLVDKFIGDAVMATWTGGPVGRGARNALRTALEISQATRKIGESVPEIKTPLSIGAAINTGEAMLGNMGLTGHRDSTVIGDVVNVAFRLEAMTEQDEADVVIGEETARHLDNPTKYFTQRSFELKGKTGRINAYACSFAQLAYYLSATAAHSR
ncbi:MAG: adenylate/guanylate cyclase domain-containing protein [Desulfurivibrionaceae bacterium]|nr:adenylate/guanylate cyclase domain-containing protein [Desulfobulbales bacterium]MDT8334295.1 adenylate/guanylate cyclase domain-containing protein [Desulfurivibrionaceae bacterium]